jgi:hypothetical protein
MQVNEQDGIGYSHPKHGVIGAVRHSAFGNKLGIAGQVEVMASMRHWFHDFVASQRNPPRT